MSNSTLLPSIRPSQGLIPAATLNKVSDIISTVNQLKLELSQLYKFKKGLSLFATCYLEDLSLEISIEISGAPSMSFQREVGHPNLSRSDSCAEYCQGVDAAYADLQTYIQSVSPRIRELREEVQERIDQDREEALRAERYREEVRNVIAELPEYLLKYLATKDGASYLTAQIKEFAPKEPVKLKVPAKKAATRR